MARGGINQFGVVRRKLENIHCQQKFLALAASLLLDPQAESKPDGDEVTGYMLLARKVLAALDDVQDDLARLEADCGPAGSRLWQGVNDD